MTRKHIATHEKKYPLSPNFELLSKEIFIFHNLEKRNLFIKLSDLKKSPLLTLYKKKSPTKIFSLRTPAEIGNNMTNMK